MNITIGVFDPHYWMFHLGISLNRYEEQDEKSKWVRKELDIGLLILSIRFDFIFKK